MGKLAFLRGAAIGMAVLLLSACQTVKTTEGGVVGVERKQMMLISSEEITSTAQLQYTQTLGVEKQKNALNRNARQVKRVRDIANRLIPHTAVFRPDAVNWQWEINVITSNEVNAWCMPGGKIAVYTGLIDKLKVTDDELAAVLGHEIAHALREHARERASTETVAETAITVGSKVLKLDEMTQQGVRYAYKGLWSLPNSREHETESDRIGIELAARAGFDPNAAVSLWQKMGAVSGSEMPAFLSTHPSTEDRVADLTKYAALVKPLYDEALLLKKKTRTRAPSKPQVKPKTQAKPLTPVSAPALAPIQAAN
jgi:predicted Zn-dependent protease